MGLVRRNRLRHAGLEVRERGHADRRRLHGHRSRRYVDHARFDGSGRGNPQALRDRHDGRVRFLPRLPRRDRRPKRHPCFLHHACRRRHGGPHAKRQAERHPARRDGALRIRSSGRLERAVRHWRQRIRTQVAKAVGLAENRYGTDGRNHVAAGQRLAQHRLYRPRRVQPVFRLRRLSVHRLLALRACLRGSAGHLRADHQGRGFDSRISAGMPENFLESECVSCGACVQACPTDALREKSVLDKGLPEHSVVTTCAYCGVGCRSRPKCVATNWYGWCPTRTARPIAAIPASRAASPGAIRRTRSASSTRWSARRSPIRGGKCRWDEAFTHIGQRVPAHAVSIWPHLDRRHHLVALHE